MGINGTVPGRRWGAALAGIVLIAAACTSSGAGASPAASAAASVAAAPAPSASTAASAALPTDRYSQDDYGTPASKPPASAKASAEAGGSGDHEVSVVDSPDGKHLAGANGMTLYIFKKDSPGKSACAGDCATNWPPFTLSGDDKATAGAGVTGKLSTIKRADGDRQVAYDGAPLYYYSGDSGAGDTNGEGVGGVWFVAAP